MNKADLTFWAGAFFLFGIALLVRRYMEDTAPRDLEIKKRIVRNLMVATILVFIVGLILVLLSFNAPAFSTVLD